MKILVLPLLILLKIGFLQAQEPGFPFGQITLKELDMKIYPGDSSASALVLNEFGSATLEWGSEIRISHHFHTKIKILADDGKQYGDFQIPLFKHDDLEMKIFNIKATTYNKNGNTWKESALDNKKIFYVRQDKETTIVKFALPEVRVGSIIEVMYELETPFTLNFIPWSFQSEIPKMHSEFWAKYPTYYTYNITLKGLLQLTKNDAEVIKNCIGRFSGPYKADCSLIKFAMDSIPAFQEEEYMTSKRNFLSAIHFELEQAIYPDGSVKKLTKEWRDVEQELKENEYFGLQIKRARNLYQDKVKGFKNNAVTEMDLATQIHTYCKTTFSWNGENDDLTEVGVKKLAETFRGNSADLNLSMLGMLLEAGVYAEPVLLSTRTRGLPIMAHPVLSDFNYVLVRVRIDNKFYFLDATSPLNTVGFLPERCLNEKGRALEETSDWIDLKPSERRRIVTDLKVKLDPSGKLSGSASISYYGYAAHSLRINFFKQSVAENYTAQRVAEWPNLEISNFSIEQTNDLTKPVIEKFDWRLSDYDGGGGLIYFPLVPTQQALKNPFKLRERLYPVDFGAPEERIFIIRIEYPANFLVDDLPKNIALSMPNSGGKLLFSSTLAPGVLNISCALSLTKPVYVYTEYQALREIYSQYVSLIQSVIAIKKK